MGNQVNAQQKFVNLLQSESNEALEENLKQILLLNITQDQYLTAFFPSDIRDVLKKNPERILGIVSYLHNFLCDAHNELQANVQYLQWKNSLRILTSIFPILYEEQFKEQMLKILWYTKIPKNHEEIQDIDPPLVISLIKRLVNMCFVFGFTVDSEQIFDTIQSNDTLLQYFVKYFKENWNDYKLKSDLLWKGFNTQCKYQNDILKYYENRYLVLSCIESIISQTLFEKEFYFPVEEVLSIRSNHQHHQNIQIENQQNERKEEENQIEEDNQFKQNYIEENSKENQKTVRTYIVQNPNAILMSILKMPFFPELFVSSIAFSFYPTERIKQFLKNMTNVSNQEEENLQNACILFVELILGGQNLVFNNKDEIAEKFNQEMKIAKFHFDQHNCPFPQLVALPLEIQESILTSLTAKFYSYYQSQQQFISGWFEKQIKNSESQFYFLCLLALKNNATIPNLFKVLILTYFYPQNQVKKLSFIIIKQISLSLQMNKQLNLSQEFTLPFTNTPLIIGTWGDLLITTLCSQAIQDFSKLKDKYLNDISVILFNIAQDVGKINESSATLLCKLIQIMANYDVVLKSPLMLSTVTNFIGAVSQILYYSYEQNLDLMFYMFQVHKSIKLVIDLKITVKKLEIWYTKHVNKNEVVNRSFIKSQQNNQNDVQEIRDSQVRSITQQQGHIQKASQSIKQQEEIQSLNMIEQIQSERTQRNSVDYRNYLMAWKNYDYEKVKLQQPLQSLNALITWLTNQKKSNYDRRLDFEVLYEGHNVKQLMGKQQLMKIPVNQFDAFKKLTKYIWLNFLRNSGKFPYFEKSECQYFEKYIVKK